MKLNDASSYLTTFWIPFGRYQYLHMPFGTLAQEEFQKRMHTVLQGLYVVEVITDDILVHGYGDTDEVCQLDHDAKLKCLLH